MGAQQGSFKNITGTRFDADGKLSVGAHKVFLECVCKSGQRTQREAFVYIPDLPLNASSRIPMILAFHGGGGHAPGFEAYTQFNEYASLYGFIAVYANGTGHLNMLTWNAGPGKCGYAAKNNVDDVGFVLDLLRYLNGITSMDPTRVYATGFSNGAMLCYRLAADAEASAKICAICPVAGALLLPEDEFLPSRPIPILHIHSQDDPRALYDGGLGPPFPIIKTRISHPAVVEVLEQWQRYNRCQPDPVAVSSSCSMDQTQKAIKYFYAGSDGSPDIVHWKLHGVGHTWPSKRNIKLPRLVSHLCGPETAAIDAIDEMWLFFSQYSL